MKDIKQSLKVLMAAEKDRKLVEKFARSKCDEHLSKIKFQEGTFHYYDKFEIVSKSIIQVHFIYGAGEREYNDFIEVDLDD